MSKNIKIPLNDAALKEVADSFYSRNGDILKNTPLAINEIIYISAGRICHLKNCEFKKDRYQECAGTKKDRKGAFICNLKELRRLSDLETKKQRR